MNEKPLVSIVTPSLNQGQFIRATIDSILCQGYENIEYWVIDGGSTDDTLDILRSYGDQINWLSEPDKGQSHAVNKGWLRARGAVLGWVNADDLLTPAAVEIAVQNFVEHPHVGAVFGDAMYIDEHGSPIKSYPARAFDFEKLVVETEDYIPQTSVFIRKGVLDKVGFLDETLHYVMDYDFWLRLGCHTTMQYVPVEMAWLRLHTGAKTVHGMQNFAREFSLIFEKLFSNSALAQEVQQQKQKVMQTAYIHSASFCFWGGNTSQALFYLRKAWREKPFPSRRAFWVIFLFSIFCKIGWRLAEFLHGNPMRLERGILYR